MVQDKIQTVLKFAGEQHANQQVTGSTANYLLHISNVLMEVLMGYHHQSDFDIELAAQIAALHDVIEDCEVTTEEMVERFGEDVTNGVLALTKNESLPTKPERMKDSLERINKLSKEVGIVKIADRITNLQKPPQSWSSDKKSYYVDEAYQILEAMKGKHTYLESRLLSKIEAYKAYV